MIVELRVRDLATIADVTLEFGDGLNVLSGETGAGKSMLVDALALLLGERADSQQVRPGAGRTVVEGVFEISSPRVRSQVEELGLDVEDQRVVIRREVQSGGRSRAWVNGSPTTASVLSQLGGLLVDLHGQHETQSLLRPDAQRDILDAYGNAEAEREAVLEAYRVLHQLRDNETELTTRRDEVRRRADYLRHVVKEIDEARIKPGEDESLEAEARRLNHAGQLVEYSERIAGVLGGEEGNALAAVQQADRALTSLEKIDPATSAWREMLDAAYANLSELSRVAAEYASRVQEDPSRLAEIERRRDVFFRLTQKYGATLAAVTVTREEAARELDLLDTADTDLKAIAARRVAAGAALRAAADALSTRRKDAAGRLARGVNRLLANLGLPGGKLSVALEPLAEPVSLGQEEVTYVVSLNAGLEPRALARSASGGELSRIMLALKVVLAGHDAIPTLIFDEVDQGIGGEIGREVGEALAQVSARHQVLVITHLPQIAARSDRHLLVSKQTRGGMATSSVEAIHGEDRVSEIARMLGDAEGTESRKHAQAMLTRVMTRQSPPAQDHPARPPKPKPGSGRSP
jgi:DNA repair protein RecN (Recombination protein N)